MNNDELDLERDVIELADEDGNVFTMDICDYFYYNGEEYAVLQDSDSEDLDTIVVMKVNPFVDENGEEMEEFVPVEEALMEVLLKVARTRMLEETDDSAEDTEE